MTIPATTRKAGPFNGTGAQTAFPFTFKVFATSDILVTIANSLGVETALVLNTDYSVSLNADQTTSPGGAVTYPLAGSPLPTGSRLVIIGAIEYDQPMVVPPGGNFNATSFENQLDRHTIQIQQLKEQVGRAVQVSVTTGANVSLPAPAANTLIGWNQAASGMQNFPLSDIATALAFATYRYDTFTGDGATTSFALTVDPVSIANMDVAVAGVVKTPGTDYTLTGGSVVFTAAPSNLAKILVRYGQGVSSGSDALGVLYDGGSVQDVLDTAKPMASYTALRSYTGRATSVRITASGIAGFFRRDDADVTSADNGGTIIVDASSRRWKRIYDGAASVSWFGAVGDGATDDAAAIQAACNAVSFVYFPPTSAYYKIATTITLKSGAHIYGAQQTKSIIGAWACNAFTINGSDGDHVTIENLELRNYTAGGVIDAKTNYGIRCAGTNANHVNYFTGRKLYIRGFSGGVDWEYTWNSVIDNVTTINIGADSLRLFGQSVNNSVNGSFLLANGGNASIHTVKDGATQGEGLMVANTLLAQGTYGVQSDGFLSLNIANCTIDLITSNGIDLTNANSFTLANSWVYAQTYGVHLQALGAPVDVATSITGCRIEAAAANGKAVYVEGNNTGVSINGGTLICTTNGRLVHVDGSGVSVIGLHCVNGGALPSIFFNGSDCVARYNTGSAVVQWNVGVPSQKGYAVATAAFEGSTGTPSLLTGCSVTRNGVGDYTVTFDNALASASYAPIVTMDRGGNGAMGYAVTSRLAGSFRFTCTNQTGTATDPTNVWVAVFN